MAVQESRVWKRYKEQGYKWLASDKVGGQCVYKNKPITYDGIFWTPIGGWHYVDLEKTHKYVDAGQEPVLIDDVLDKRIKPKVIKGSKKNDIVIVCMNCHTKFKSKPYRNQKFCCRKCACEYKSKQAMKRADERIAQKKEKAKEKLEKELKKLQIRLLELEE